jgi:hypothetical protein
MTNCGREKPSPRQYSRGRTQAPSDTGREGNGIRTKLARSSSLGSPGWTISNFRALVPKPEFALPGGRM